MFQTTRRLFLGGSAALATGVRGAQASEAGPIRGVVGFGAGTGCVWCVFRLIIELPYPATMSDQDGLPTPRRHYATLAIMATLVLVVLDGAIANVALPTLAVTLNVSAATSVRVVNGYQLALVMTLLPCAALGEGLGLRRVFTAGVAAGEGCVAEGHQPETGLAKLL